MDWDLAIKRNSEALNGIVAALFAMLGNATVALGGPEAPSPELEFKFPKHVYSD